MRIGRRASVTFCVIVLAACSADTGDAAPQAEVHQAEVAQGVQAETAGRGEAVYLQHCAACHQPDGTGLGNAFPPLADSDYLLGDRQEVLAAALFGLSGPITVNGVDYDGVMPSMGLPR